MPPDTHDDGTDGEPGDTPQDDAESRRMIARLQAREPQAFEDLYSRYFSRVYGFVRSLLDTSADAEDVTHHVFEEMLRAVDRGQLQKVQSLRAWLLRIARNSAVDHQRKHDRVDVIEPGDAWEGVTRLPGDPGAYLADPGWTFSDPALAAALRRLSPQQREVLLLRYVEDFDLAEIAATIGSTVSSVQNAHSKALQVLRQQLGPL